MKSKKMPPGHHARYNDLITCCDNDYANDKFQTLNVLNFGHHCGPPPPGNCRRGGRAPPLAAAGDFTAKDTKFDGVEKIG